MTEITKVKVNDHKVKPVVQDGAGDPRPILGADLIPHLYCTMFLVAKKKSGKTSVVNYILEKCAGKDTEVIVFCSTWHKDPTWEQIRNRLDKRGINYQGFTDLVSGGVNLLEEWMRSQSEGPVDAAAAVEPALPARRSNVSLLLESKSDDANLAGKPRKSKYQMPETIFVFDDFSKELRNPVVADFIKRHRHYKTKVIISSQYVKDIVPATGENMDLWLLFRGRHLQDLEHIYRLASPSVDFETFAALYKDATKEHFSFLYADVTNDEYRKSFNEKYSIRN